MVGRRNDHRVDVVASDDLAPIAGRGAILVAVMPVDRVAGRVTPPNRKRRKRPRPGRLEFQAPFQIPAQAMNARADESERDPVARRVGPKYARRHDGGKARNRDSGGQCLPEKCPARYVGFMDRLHTIHLRDGNGARSELSYHDSAKSSPRSHRGHGEADFRY